MAGLFSNELSDGLLALFDLALQQRIAVVRAAIGFGYQ
jgi:hypothetical protein